MLQHGLETMTAAQLRRRTGARPPLADWLLVESAPGASDPVAEMDAILAAWETCDAETRSLRQDLAGRAATDRRRAALARRLAERERDGRFLLQRLAETHAGRVSARPRPGQSPAGRLG